MTQLSLTDDRILNASTGTDADANDTGETTEGTTEPDSDITVERDSATGTNAGPDTTDLGPVADHPAVRDVDIEGMELETPAEGWDTFPHPATIRAHVEEDMDADRATFPAEVQDAIDELTDDPDLGDFLVFDATAAYEYLEKLQWQSDLHLENFHRRQLIVNQLSGGRGYAKGSSLSTYDKKWICEWEVRRRLANRDFDTWKESKLTKENHGLPNADN